MVRQLLFNYMMGFFYLLVLSFIISVPVLHADQAIIQQGLKKGIDYFKSNKYKEAASELEALLSELKSSGNQGTLMLGRIYPLIGKCYYFLKDYPSSLKNYELGIKVNSNLNNTIAGINLHRDVIRLFDEWGKKEKSILYHKKLLGFDSKLKVTDKLNSFTEIADHYFNESNADSSIHYYLLAREHSLKDVYVNARINNQLGILHFNNKSYDNALEAFFISEKLLLTSGRKKDLSDIYKKIGLAYFSKAVLDSTIIYYRKAYVLDGMLNDRGGIVICLQKLANCYDLQLKYDKALFHYNELLKMQDNLKPPDIIIGYYGRIRDIHEEMGNISKASEFSEKIEILLAKGNNYKKQITNLIKLGFYFGSLDKMDKAIGILRRSLLLTQTNKDKDLEARVFSGMGRVYFNSMNLDSSVICYKAALALDEMKGSASRIKEDIDNLGIIFMKQGKYSMALEAYERSYKLSESKKDSSGISDQLNNIGMVYKLRGQYDLALERFNRALDLDIKLKILQNQSRDKNNIGSVYDAWHKPDEALTFFNDALIIDIKLKHEKNMAVDLNNIGGVYHLKGEYDKAIKYYSEALDINKKLNHKPAVARQLNNIAGVYIARAQYGKALGFFKRSLEISRSIGQDAEVAKTLNNLGMISHKNNNIKGSIDFFNRAYTINKKLARKADMARDLNNLGTAYYAQKNYSEAINMLNESIYLKEQIRLTAKGTARRDYFASELYTYQGLTETYMINRNIPQAYKTMERSRAKLLSEKLTGQKKPLSPINIKEFQELLSPDDVVFAYANVNWDTKIIIILTKNKIDGFQFTDSSFVANTRKKFKLSNINNTILTRGMKTVNTYGFSRELKKLSNSKNKEVNFQYIIKFYHRLLSHPSANNIKTSGELSQKLYDLLIRPYKKYLAGKKNLIIMADGILSYVPFETLLNGKNEYLTIDYNISYIQSMRILDLINKRKYSSKRKSLLAIGGCVYDSLGLNIQQVETEKELTDLSNESLQLITESKSLRSSYNRLGYSTWPDLPGTIDEIKKISKIIKGAKIIKGSKASESIIKGMALNDELNKYKIIHFATHGVVIPELAEMSALVLSQFKEIQNGEDGYLHMNEISNMKLNADFVNLSACETGLGKLYEGEGIVGLTQAFLISGANGVLVSLWSVADKSTLLFMVELYKLTITRGMNYAEATQEVKKKFIAGEFGDKYKELYYWAPFVYYGKR